MCCMRQTNSQNDIQGDLRALYSHAFSLGWNQASCFPPVPVFFSKRVVLLASYCQSSHNALSKKANKYHAFPFKPLDKQLLNWPAVPLYRPDVLQWVFSRPMAISAIQHLSDTYLIRGRRLKPHYLAKLKHFSLSLCLRQLLQWGRRWTRRNIVFRCAAL